MCVCIYYLLKYRCIYHVCSKGSADTLWFKRVTTSWSLLDPAQDAQHGQIPPPHGDDLVLQQRIFILEGK